MRKFFLKRKLKSIYKQIAFGFEDYNCGHTLLSHMSSSYYNLCKKFNETADKLAKLDPDCPKHRYKLD